VAFAATVTAGNPQGWVAWQTNTASHAFVVGPGTPPAGTGSLSLATGSGSGAGLGGKVFVGNACLDGTNLSNFPTISYCTYVHAAPQSNLIAPSINLYVDLNGDGVYASADDALLVYEPCYNTSPMYTPVPLDTWQTWTVSATSGTWWDVRGRVTGAAGAYNRTIADIVAGNATYPAYPNAKILGWTGQPALQFVVGSSSGAPWVGYEGALDNIKIGAASYDFEVRQSAVYVDDSWAASAAGATVGNGYTFGTNAFAAIQDGIDAVDAGGTVYVYPGTYSETATNRWVAETNGPHQFGLYFGTDKTGVTLQGVDAAGAAITSYDNVAATVNTNATNNFGVSGIFVEGDSVAIKGLQIGPNTNGDNKTVEIIGDGFTLQNCKIDFNGGCVYFGDWAPTATTSHIASYTVDSNYFGDGAFISISNGAGLSGDVVNRKITNNVFADNSVDFPCISIRGIDPCGWRNYSVGGMTITGNTFGVSKEYIRVTGIYDNSQFNWQSYWNDNTYPKAVMVGPNPPAQIGTYTIDKGSYVIPDCRRIGGLIQGEVDNAVAGDIVMVKAGTYNENVVVAKQITLSGAGSGADAASSTIIDPASGNGVTLQTGGASAGSRLIVKDLRVRGAAQGIRFDSNKTLQWITLDNVAAVGNSESGVNLRECSTYGDILLRNVVSTDNAGSGVQLQSTSLVLDGLAIQGGEFSRNAGAGFMAQGGSVTGVGISGATFSGNAKNANTNGDVVLTGFNGNLAMSNVTITSDQADCGIRLSGDDNSGYRPMGTVSLSNVTINGMQRGAGIALSRYTNASGLSLSDVTLASTAPAGLHLGSVSGTANLGNTAFTGTFSTAGTEAGFLVPNPGDIVLGTHRGGSSYPVSTANVDATGCSFAGKAASTMGLSELLALETKIWHRFDLPTLGLVNYGAFGNLCLTWDKDDQNFYLTVTPEDPRRNGIKVANGETYNLGAAAMTIGITGIPGNKTATAAISVGGESIGTAAVRVQWYMYGGGLYRAYEWATMGLDDYDALSKTAVYQRGATFVTPDGWKTPRGFYGLGTFIDLTQPTPVPDIKATQQ